MESPILVGLDTEYGLWIEARGAQDQVEDATAFVRAYPGPHFAGWDYRFESPRADLRGFRLDHLAVDPVDAQFDRDIELSPSDIRSDRILPNGARFYNDHGHPEYATPECLTLEGLVRSDLYGDEVLLQTARAYAAQSGRGVIIHKNNTDFHGASWGAHENYLAPRPLGFERLFAAMVPMLIARQILCGAGKVGSESGTACDFQLSQRADFLVEPANAETLYRRPLFNTRDEPHGPAPAYIRLHVICGDANRLASSTRFRVGLARIALKLAIADSAPLFDIPDPVRAFSAVSRDATYRFAVPLRTGHTDAYAILDSYFGALQSAGLADAEDDALIDEARGLLHALTADFGAFARRVDWAAKRRMLESIMSETGTDWGDPALRSYDLEYHNLDPDESLFHALLEMEAVDPNPAPLADPEPTRAAVRGYAVSHHSNRIISASWRSLVIRDNDAQAEFELPPDIASCEQVQAVREQIFGSVPPSES